MYRSDLGMPYASGEYRALLAAAGLAASMSRKGNSYDNAAMETLNATYNWECVRLAEVACGYPSWAEATADFFAALKPVTAGSVPQCIRLQIIRGL